MRARHYLFALPCALALVHCSPSGEHEDEPSSVITESKPGSLVITTPERASFVKGDGATEVQVRGTGATKGLEINGQPVEVEPDGSFHTTVKPSVGLNLIVAKNGESRLERPFLFGKFVSPETLVPHAIAVDVGAQGLSAPLPSASVESVTNLALKDRNLLEMLAGKTFSGSMTAADWTFTVNRGSNGTAEVRLGAIDRGLNVSASVNSVAVDGRLTMTSLGIEYARDVRITVSSAAVKGDVAIGLDGEAGTLKTAMPNVEAKLEDFQFDTDNAGFPCCVDSILNWFIAPKVEEAVTNGIREQLPSVLGLTLEGLGVPKEVDYSVSGLSLKFPMKTKFDSMAFDAGGAFITAATQFGGKPKPGTPGAAAPGWLSFGSEYTQPKTHVPMLGVSFSIDAINQLLYAAWGSGSLSFTAPPPLNAKLSPGLPPLVSVTDSGALRIGLSEILIERAGALGPLAAVSIMQDVAASTDGDALVLEPSGKATISITWLTDDREGSGKDLIAGAAKSQLEKYTQPFRIPVPKFALDKLGGGFAGRSLAFGAPSITFAKASSRVEASGKFTFAETR